MRYKARAPALLAGLSPLPWAPQTGRGRRASPASTPTCWRGSGRPNSGFRPQALRDLGGLRTRGNLRPCLVPPHRHRAAEEREVQEGSQCLQSATGGLPSSFFLLIFLPQEQLWAKEGRWPPAALARPPPLYPAGRTNRVRVSSLW